MGSGDVLGKMWGTGKRESGGGPSGEQGCLGGEEHEGGCVGCCGREWEGHGQGVGLGKVWRRAVSPGLFPPICL